MGGIKNCGQRIEAIIITMSIIVGLFSGVQIKGVMAAERAVSNLIWDGTIATSFASGSGTSSDPYVISTGAELAYLAESVNAGISYGGKYIVLENDIFLNDISDFDSWSNDSEPDNIWKGMNDFCGTIDGHGKTIYGMYVCNSEDNSGFINSSKNMSNSRVTATGKAIIKNTNFRNSYVYGTANVGTIIGRANYAEIDNCKVEGKVTATKSTAYAGGFVGYFSSGGDRGISITNSSANVHVSGNSYVGGFIGYASVGNSSGYSTSGNGSEKITVRDCTNCGIVDGKGNYVGGVAGSIIRSMNCGGLDIKRLCNNGKISGDTYVGGLFGYLKGSYYAISLDESNNSGNISGTKYVGGLVGYASSGTSASRATMQNLYNTGLISATSYAGGIFGVGSYVNILYSYNLGTINGESNLASLIGYASYSGLYGNMANVKYSYYLLGTSQLDTAGSKTNVNSFVENEINNPDTFKGFDFENTWKICKDYPKFQWQQDEDSDYIDNNENYDIVKCVSEYTSDEIYAQYDAISNSDYSYETKHKMWLSIFSSYGITNVNEGIRYLSNTTNKRYAYLNLTNNELYCASNFQYMLDNTAKGHLIRGLLLADGLVFNGEINDWLDFTTYSESDYPGVAKYKAMLYDFMDTASETVEIQSDIKLISDLSKNVTGAAKLKADNLIAKLNACASLEEEKAILESGESLGVWTELSEKRDENGNVVLSYTLDKSSGFGQFAKAMGTATKTVSIVDMTVTDVIDFLTLDSKLAVYAQYKAFLQDIVSNTEYVPFQLRWAASQILEELDGGYLAEIKDIAFDILEKTEFNKVVRENILGKVGASSIASWLGAINIESFFINKIADIGSMVKSESCVEGYAYLANAFKRQLEVSKQTFIKNRTEENAWDFYYNYNILYKLRYKGEEAYLAMTKVKGIAEYFCDYGYSLKEAVVNETLTMLKKKCQFTFDEAESIPESCQFATKSVINCPVNVDVYAPNGTMIASLIDGEESDMTNAYGRFAVIYDTYSDDYVKVVCLNSDENFTFKFTGINDGLVSMELAQKEEKNVVYTFDNVPISTGAVIKADIEQITKENSYGFDNDGDNVIDVTGTITAKTDEYNAVNAISLHPEELKLVAGESAVIHVEVAPSDASNQTISWMSVDPTVAVVSDGKVIAVSGGTTDIYCTSLDNTEFVASCKVTVAHLENADTESDISTCTVAVENATYTGKPLTPEVTVKNGNDVLIRDIDYTVFYNNNIDAGIATVTVNGIGNYTGTVKKEFAINKANQLVTADVVTNRIKEGETVQIIADGMGTISYSSDNSNIATVDSRGVVTGVSEGTAIITITAEGDNNYNSGKKEISIFVIGKQNGDEKTSDTTNLQQLTQPILKNISNTTSGIRIKWKKVSGASGYYVYRKAGNKNWKRIAILENGRTISYTDKVVKTKNGKTYSYTVAAYSDKMTSTYNKMGKKIVRMTAPKLLKLINEMPQKVTVKWKKNAKTTGYQIQYSTSAKFKDAKSLSVRSKKLTLKSIKKLKKGKIYYVRIRCYKKIGKNTYYSAWNNKKSIKIKK